MRIQVHTTLAELQEMDCTSAELQTTVQAALAGGLEMSDTSMGGVLFLSTFAVDITVEGTAIQPV